MKKASLFFPMLLIMLFAMTAAGWARKQPAHEAGAHIAAIHARTAAARRMLSRGCPELRSYYLRTASGREKKYWPVDQFVPYALHPCLVFDLIFAFRH